jgi:hypothetical protein
MSSLKSAHRAGMIGFSHRKEREAAKSVRAAKNVELRIACSWHEPVAVNQPGLGCQKLELELPRS